MRRCLREADTVLVVSTPKLKARYENSASLDEGAGATYEGALVMQELYERHMRNDRFFPVLPDGGTRADVPDELKPWFNGHCFPSGRDRILRLVLSGSRAPDVDAATARREPRRGPLPTATLPRVSQSMLPQTSGRLFGRKEELRLLDAWSRDGVTRVVSVIAWGGVGKSALVNRFLLDMARTGHRTHQ